MFIHGTQLVGTDGLQRGSTVSYDTVYDDRKGKYKAVNCTTIPSGGGGGGTPNDGGDDVFIHRKRQCDTEELLQGETLPDDTEYDDREEKARKAWAKALSDQFYLECLAKCRRSSSSL